MNQRLLNGTSITVALLLGAGRLFAQPTISCTEISHQIGVAWRQVKDGDTISEKSILTLHIKASVPTQQLSNVTVLANGKSILGIEGPELLTLEKDGEFSIAMSASFGTKTGSAYSLSLL